MKFFLSIEVSINGSLRQRFVQVWNQNSFRPELKPNKDINDKNKKKVILVDHNEIVHSVDGIEESDIIEVIDHHKIGTLTTSSPINFRNMAVGSTNTIIHQLYEENNFPIPKDIAGIMLSGIISDTLLLKSPTTTQLDKQAVFRSHILN